MTSAATEPSAAARPRCGRPSGPNHTAVAQTLPCARPLACTEARSSAKPTTSVTTSGAASAPRRASTSVSLTTRHRSRIPAYATAAVHSPPRRTLDPVIEVVRAGRVDYATAWDWQKRLHAQRVAGEVPDTVLLLEHDPVYTAGKRTEPWERPTDGTPVIDVDRGGRITWHGPGQLTGYPIVALTDPVDVVAYVRRLEGALIEVCATFGVTTTRVEGRSGVWTGDGQSKVAAIGIRVARGVTMHGFALNCDCDLAAFGAIVPCGITDAGVTSLTNEAGRAITVADALPVVERELDKALSAVPLMS
ncbi:MAG: lipoyl(octanoyl) transferase LipB [Frankiaceae bacterium]|nr:lipoyl(octanoyl) transferase LipB [Frankiaceae bacterium]MBV9368843.1 lipoyl(octanoyl) transferase LipB [Frankiales bacterium]